MTTLITTWIMWAIVATTNPNVSAFVVIDEYKDREKCIEIAKVVSLQSAKEFEQRGAAGIESITIVCLPVATRILKNVN
jgi:hypothetical protein